jgi:lysyl-tRNA synthetase class 2
LKDDPDGRPVTILGSQRPYRATAVPGQRRDRARTGPFRRIGFVEVETSALQVSPGNETHVHAFRTELISPGDKRDRCYLRTSRNSPARSCWPPGAPLVEFARVFRNRERTPLHHPEFTLIEWYRAQAATSR